MKVLLDIKESKAEFVLELLSYFSFVKIKQLTPYKAQVFKDLADAVADMKLIKEGILKPRHAKELLDEL
jgi:hypothetical protein